MAQAHIIDNEFYGDGWGTPEMREVFDGRRRYQRWLDIEAALAKVQGELGVIPKEAAEEIIRKAKLELVDIDKVKEDLAATGHSLVPLLRGVQRICEGNLGEYIHYGPTTQDIQDTAAVLELKDAWKILLRDLKAIEGCLIDLADRYKNLPMAGRTHNQQGLPITLGLKFAGWLAEIRRDIERMKDLREFLFVGMLHGGTGTMAGLGEKAYPVAEGLMKELGINLPTTGWGTSRDTFADYMTVLGLVAGTIGRITNEIFQLSRTEILELHEPLGENYVGSSTMPHKRNAEVSEFVVAMCRIVIGNVPLGLQCMISEHERDTRSWRMDWHTLPESSIMLAKALSATKFLLGGLQVYEDRIAKNLDMLHGLLFSEALMFHLGEKVGKQTAHHLIHGAAMKAQTQNLSFRDVLFNSPEVMEHTTREELEEVMDYTKHVGQSAGQVEAAISFARERSANDDEYLNC